MKISRLLKILLGICGLGVFTAIVLLWPSEPAQANSTADIQKEVAVDSDTVSSNNFMPTQEESETKTEQTSGEDIPAGVRILMEVYPDFVKGYQDEKVLMTDGTMMVYDDKRAKSFLQKLDDADIEDMFAFKYDLSSWTPGYLQDAGRSRCEAFFKKMYGASASQVQKHLVKVPWFGQQVQFTTVNHAADSLRAAAAEFAKHPDLKPYLKSSGSFYWRKVRGANRQSAHSYGMTIDIGVKYSDYWLWKNPGKKETDKITYANRMPHKLVEIFERHGFIWGGRWYHYDTMHFEFRPEILR